jgi:hypothetical protein
MFMSYCTGLFAGIDKQALEEGVKTMLQIALKLVKEKKTSSDRMLRDEDDDIQ